MSVKPELYGIVLKSHASLNVADYLKWLSTVVNPKSVQSFGKVAGNNYGIFFSNEQDRDKVLELDNVKVNKVELRVNQYAPAVKTVFIKGVPMLENDQPVSDFMSQFGTLKTKPTRLPLKDVPVGLEHVLSHTLVVKMVLKSDDTLLPNYAKIDVGSDIIKVKIEHGFKKCFQCGERGHERKLCPNNIDEFPEATKDSQKVSQPKILFPNVNQMTGKTKETVVENATTDEVATADIEMVAVENPWKKVQDKGKRRRGIKVPESDKQREEGEFSSQETSPTNETKTPKLLTTKSKLHDSFSEWKEMTIGNGHLSNEKILQFLVAGSEDVNVITQETAKYSNNPSLLRRQLEALIGKIPGSDLKSFIREVCEAIPMAVSSIN